MSAATVAIGAGVAAGAVGGALIQANAAKNAGQAQLSAAQQQVALAQQGVRDQLAARQNAISQAAQVSAMSAGEIQGINSIFSNAMNGLSSSLASISKQQAQVDAMAPQVGQAGKDLYDLLSGKASAMLAPIQQQRDQQRLQLQNQLASQMGGGYATSTAGIQALMTFDTQTASMMSQTQLAAVNQATSTYSSTAGLQNSGQNAITSQTQNAFGQMVGASEAVTQANQNVANRQTNAFATAESNNPVNFQAPAGAQQSVTNVAGNPFAGQAIAGQTIGGLANTVGTVGMLSAAGAFKGAGTTGGTGANPFASSSNIGNYQLPQYSSPAGGLGVGA